MKCGYIYILLHPENVVEGDIDVPVVAGGEGGEWTHRSDRQSCGVQALPGGTPVPRRGLAIPPGEPGKPILACVSAPREEG